MKNPALLISAPCFSLLFACNTTPKTDSEAERQSADSIRKADSTKTENAFRDEREQYRKKLNDEMDSLDAKLAKNDALYDTKIQKDHEKWLKNREILKARIKRLRQEQVDAGTVAKDKWTEFKLKSDTAFDNLKTDWNKMLDGMKAK